jgi:hypothetical protein
VQFHGDVGDKHTPCRPSRPCLAVRAWRLSNRSTRFAATPRAAGWLHICLDLAVFVRHAPAIAAPVDAVWGATGRLVAATASRRCQVGTSPWIPSRLHVARSARPHGDPRTERSRDAAGHLICKPLVLRGSQPQPASGPGAPAYGSSWAAKPRSVGFAKVSSRSPALQQTIRSAATPEPSPASPQRANVSLVGRNGGGAERWVLQWARHGAILSLLTSRDLC